MAKVTLTIPDKVVDQIIDMGFDLQSWFELQFIRPVLDKIRREKQKKVLEKVETELEDTIAEIHQASKIELKRYHDERFEPGVVKDLTDFPPGTGDIGLLEVVKDVTPVN